MSAGCQTLPVHVTIALPAFDEVANLEGVAREARAVLDRLGHHHDGEILVVDDGSTDGTGELADRLALAVPGLRVLHHGTNRGFTGAMTTCFRQAAGDWVFLAPADGQTSLDELEHFLTLAAHADVVVGVRASRPEPLRRIVLSRGFHTIARALFALPEREFSSAFLFRRALLDAMPFRSHPRSATLLPEILYRARRRRARVVTTEVQSLPRRAGQAKGGQLSVAALTLVELLRLAPLIRLDERRGARARTERGGQG